VNFAQFGSKLILNDGMKKLQAWLPLLFALVMILGMSIGYKLRENVPGPKGLFAGSKRTSIQEVMDLIRMKYVDPVNTDTLTDGAVEAMLDHLDPHSVFIPARHLAEINEDLMGNFEGIGVEFQIIDDTVNVVSVLPLGPSDKAGLQVGDKFLKVGDSLVANRNITSERIKTLLRGEGGSKVSATILRGQKAVTFTITRGTIPLFSVDAAYMMDSVTGYIHLNKFSGTTYEEFMQAMERLNGEGMKRLVFDLRDNGGGILGEAVDIADEFLDNEKLIVYTEGATQPKTEYKCKRPGLFEKGKLVVVIDENSASASEVLAGALQDWDRATIVGRRSFGKGLVQEQYPLSDGSALRLTVARYYTPTGRSIQKSYSNGREAYDEEVLARLEHGEMVHADSIKPNTSKPYKTKGGRTVYGGGGISPDVFIPADTLSFTTDLTPMFLEQRFGKFIYTYYLRHKDYIDNFQTPADFNARFDQDEQAYRELMEYLAAKKVQMPALPERDKTELKKRIRTWLARQRWRMDGYFQVLNQYDNTIRKAVEEVKK
jgi:carboxyl-terminal processing protease